ncbi:MAG: divTM7 [Candidatus Saccharibacteria bacterium]|nr:divTM7 [Candidatus Saccharibacteria bacterium]MDB5180515.1 divTM7 [Candidatus Saccharibacteria bacterium]
MAEPITFQPDADMTFWDRHRLSLLLIITVLIALTLTVVSMVAYNVSGTAQLDLSRPGYSSVSDKVDRTDKITEYSAFGSVDKDSIDEFVKLYDAQAVKAKAVDAFNGDPLNPEILEFGSPANE